MTEIDDTFGGQTIRRRVRETLRGAPVFEVEHDLPSHWNDLLDELDRVVERRARIATI